MIGTVKRVFNTYYEVVDDVDKSYRCTLPKKLVLKKRDYFQNLVVVGDRVSFDFLSEDEGSINRIHERENSLYRLVEGRGKKARYQIIASNIDQILIISAIESPELKKGFIDRLLVFCEYQNIKPVIIINKIDLVSESDARNKVDIYETLGYKVLYVSAKEEINTDSAEEVLRDRTSVLVGHSGVGKTTLLNTICGFELFTKPISTYSKRGQHATTNANRIKLPFNGYVIDTPGIKEFGFFEIEKHGLGHYFPEMRSYLRMCKYSTCTHEHEPGCKVKEAVENGLINEERYQSYLRLLNSLV